MNIYELAEKIVNELESMLYNPEESVRVVYLRNVIFVEIGDKTYKIEITEV